MRVSELINAAARPGHVRWITWGLIKEGEARGRERAADNMFGHPLRNFSLHHGWWSIRTTLPSLRPPDRPTDRPTDPTIHVMVRPECKVFRNIYIQSVQQTRSNNGQGAAQTSLMSPRVPGRPPSLYICNEHVCVYVLEVACIVCLLHFLCSNMKFARRRGIIHTQRGVQRKV